MTTLVQPCPGSDEPGPPPEHDQLTLTRARFTDLPSWRDDHHAQAVPSFLRSCEKIAALNEGGIGFLVIEHNMDLVMSLCRPILVMAQGRLLLEGSAAEVRSDARVLEAYLGGAAA